MVRDFAELNRELGLGAEFWTSLILCGGFLGRLKRRVSVQEVIKAVDETGCSVCGEGGAEMVDVDTICPVY